MELMAAILGLSALKQTCRVSLYSDSRYLVDAVSKGWAKRWRANGWKRNKREPAINPDLWEKLLDLVDRHAVEFLWVRGHDGNHYNERCDELANNAAQQSNLPPDSGYSPGR
jgi:ribonuclease HI